MRGFISKQRVVLYLLLMLLLTTSCNQKLEERVQAYLDAHNSGDVETELSLFAENAKFEIVDQWSREGQEDLRALIETDVVLQSHLTIKDVKVSKNKVTCNLEERNDWLKLAGVDPLHYEFREFIFEKGLIKEIRSKQSEEDVKTLEKFRGDFGEWAFEHRKEEMAVLRRQSVITKDNIGKWLDLMRTWREEMAKKEQEENEKEGQ